VGGRFTWQSYVPYLQGWAKLLLERLAEDAWREGARGTVFNSPEIWTASSALFLGVELALYPLLLALREEGPGAPATEEAWARCRAALRAGATVEGLLARAEEYLAAPLLAPFRDLARWPRHTTREQLEAMLAASDTTRAMSADPKRPACAVLSPFVFQAVGRLMLAASFEPSAPVLWLNHDVVAKALVHGGAGS
jgi:hypothetical protein